MKYLLSSYTNTGGRKNNEDSLYIGESANGILLVIADGLGGHDSGEVASSLAIEVLKSFFLDCNNEFNMTAAFEEANSVILKKQDETKLKMKTTVSAAWIGEESTTFAHVGDTRIYAFKGSEIVFQSIDHSASQMAVAVGEIEPSEIRYHIDRNILTRALGADDNITVDINVIRNDAYDALILCTDGFWEYVLEEEMCMTRALSHDPENWINRMLKVLIERIPNDNDNNSAIALIKQGE